MSVGIVLPAFYTREINLAQMNTAVAIRNLSFTYANGERPALTDVRGEIAAGEFIAVLGAGDAGKSTLCLTLNGLIPHFFRGEYRGEVLIQGRPVSGQSVAGLAPQVGLVMQDFEAQLFSTNVELEMAFGPENLQLPRPVIGERIGRFLGAVGLEQMRRRDPANLSGGEKQRLAIGSVLTLEPKILVMDEPTTDLDPAGRQRIQALAGMLKDRQRTLIMTDVDTESAVTADRIWLFQEGRLVAQETPARILTDAGLLDACGLRVPPPLALFQRMGWPGAPLTVEEALGRLPTVRQKQRRERPMCLERRITTAPLIEARGISFRYPERPAEALRGVDFTIAEGEFVAILGRNGSGKTTLAKQINGLLKPTSGQMLIANRPTTAYRRHELARIVGYVFQNPDHQIFSPTVRQEVAFGLKVLGEGRQAVARRVGEALEATGLTGYEERPPFLLTKGERQRVAVASVLAVEPQVIILDEPTTGLDYHQQRDVMAMLKRLHDRGHTVIIITHAMWIAEEYATYMLVMQDGGIRLSGPTRAICLDEDRLAEASLIPSPLARLSNRLDTEALTLEGMVRELAR